MSIPSVSPAATSVTPAYTGPTTQPQPATAPDATAATAAVASSGAAAAVVSASSSVAPQLAAGPEPSTTQVQDAVDKVKQALPPNATNLSFSIDKDAHKTVIKIIDSQTNQVIKQFPSKEIIALAKSIGEFQESLGVLLRGQA